MAGGNMATAPRATMMAPAAVVGSLSCKNPSDALRIPSSGFLSPPRPRLQLAACSSGSDFLALRSLSFSLSAPRFSSIELCSIQDSSRFKSKAIRQVRCQALECHEKKNSTYEFWDSVTDQLSGSATFAFLPLQIPQIVLNYRNLSVGNAAALAAVPWTGLLTGLLGNLSLLSYFAEKKERGAAVVQAVGVLSTYIVLVQLAFAGTMPMPIFTATAVAVVIGFLVNILNFYDLISKDIYRGWKDIITVGGVSVLSQVMWTTFEPFLPSSILPGIILLALSTAAVILERLGKLPRQISEIMGGVAAWSATLLFMWGPVAQMWTNYINPSNIKGLSVYTILLAMVGNGLLLPRALFTRDLMWFTGSSWGALMQGWGILMSMYTHKCIAGSIFIGTTVSLLLWFGNMLIMDSKANSLDSVFSPLWELLFRKG
ncbi:hypothetical protein KP509_14G029800 [Ceratopteris richardii]|uniref:Maltose excess protein 1-like, chloroplastic n=1 Tax=Ceratopteris richardii TaxID=49495 RepID=A0A8T2TBP4_CERRI|nr:hypothetical protein KP509_14G029800 [Ceratopteris richardii]